MEWFLFCVRFQPVVEWELPVWRVRARAGAVTLHRWGLRLHVWQRVHCPVHSPTEQLKYGYIQHNLSPTLPPTLLFIWFIFQLFCAPTQDTDTCLCSTRTETFCPQPDSLFTSWSLTWSEMFSSNPLLFYLLLIGYFMPLYAFWSVVLIHF